MARPKKPKKELDPNLCEKGMERQFQKYVANYLREKNMYVESDQNFTFSYGSPGKPDIRFCYLGRFGAIECKSEAGVLTPAQFRAIKKIEECGGYATVATGIADVQKLLTKIENEKRNGCS